MSDTSIADLVRRLAHSGALDLPVPGGGRTAERHLALYEIARRHPVSAARLAEAHTDAIAILHEAGRRPVDGALYGVWASAGPTSGIVVDRVRSGLRVTGSKPFASGLGVVDRALVTATDRRVVAERESLVDVGVTSCRSGRSTWETPALRASATATVEFDEVVDPSSVLGPPGWYLDRVGFWHGACGPAACWAGAAAGLVDAAQRLADDDPHRRAHLGALVSWRWSFEALLEAAGSQIDRDPHDVRRARRRALAVRHRIERGVAEVLDRFGTAFGPRPFVGDAEIGQRFLDTHLYARQHHGERDLAVLGGDPGDV